MRDPRRGDRLPGDGACLRCATSRSSYGAAPALWDVSLRRRRRRAGRASSGPNGAGKTTLINAIAGLHPAASGRLVVDGRDITRLPPHRFCDAGHRAWCPEGRRLFTGMTVRENLELGSYRRARARQRAAHRSSACCALFPVLGERLDAPAGALSGRPAADGGDRPRADGAAAAAAAGRALARPRAADRAQTMFRVIRDDQRATASRCCWWSRTSPLALGDRAPRLRARGGPHRRVRHARRVAPAAAHPAGLSRADGRDLMIETGLPSHHRRGALPARSRPAQARDHHGRRA